MGIVLFSLALVEAIVAWTMLWEPADGANIGGGIAIMSAVAAAVAAAAGWWLGHRASALRWPAIVGGLLASLFALQGVVLVAFGIAEELR